MQYHNKHIFNNYCPLHNGKNYKYFITKVCLRMINLYNQLNLSFYIEKIYIINSYTFMNPYK